MDSSGSASRELELVKASGALESGGLDLNDAAHVAPSALLLEELVQLMAKTAASPDCLSSHDLDLVLYAIDEYHRDEVSFPQFLIVMDFLQRCEKEGPSLVQSLRAAIPDDALTDQAQAPDHGPRHGADGGGGEEGPRAVGVAAAAGKGKGTGAAKPPPRASPSRPSKRT